VAKTRRNLVARSMTFLEADIIKWEIYASVERTAIKFSDASLLHVDSYWVTVKKIMFKYKITKKPDACQRACRAKYKVQCHVNLCRENKKIFKKYYVVMAAAWRRKNMRKTTSRSYPSERGCIRA
jgi:hypothetical protein